jgi:hypothetical protein
MVVTIETIQFDDTTVKKFTTDLEPSASQEQDSITWICPPGITNITCLIVAGGGAGGMQSRCGGGGAGGVLHGDISVIPGTEYIIKIGAGGKIVLDSYLWYSGANSEFGEHIAIGGGKGAGYQYSNPGDGGSGGGAASYVNAVGLALQQNSGTLIGYGNNGGPYPGPVEYGAGGGGAGSAGVIKTGGNGLQSDITGISVIYATGGGGSSRINNGAPGAGGSNNVNGGRGGYYYDSQPTYSYPATPGAPNTGSGGGGGWMYLSGYNAYGASGGSGIVILRYTTSKILLKSAHAIITGSGNLLVQNVKHGVI